MSHEKQGLTDEWYTPKYIFDALGCEFDLDIASPKTKTFVPAKNFITENSLDLEWKGFIWSNPPFGGRNGLVPWNEKFIQHENGIHLTPDRTSTKWWQDLAKQTWAHLHIEGKVKFVKPDGSTGDQPSNGTTLFTIGHIGVNALLKAERNGLGAVFINTKLCGRY